MRMREVRNERGASIVIVSLSLFAMLGMAALAIDLGMLMKVRSDAQRVADAAALAGAIEYKNGNTVVIRDRAADSALKYATRNYAGWQSINTTDPIIMDSGNRRIINSPEAYIQSIPDEYKVRVWIRRAATSTWFGNLLGLDWVPIAAKAAARVAEAGNGRCIKPLVIPDLWNETTNDPAAKPNQPGQDVNNNDAWDVGEAWRYDPPTDTYAGFDPNAPNTLTQTGYGSAWRDNNGEGITGDYGRRLTMKAQNPQNAIDEAFFYMWRVPLANDSINTGKGETYRALITDTTCTVAGEASIGTTYRVENGNAVGPNRHAWEELISYDPGARWDPTVTDEAGRQGAVVGSKYSDWRDSPRVVLIGIMDPQYVINAQGGGAGGLEFKFNNFALLFLEGFDGNGAQAPLAGRFLYFAEGTGPTGPLAGSLIKKLQLVE
jgi:hypothetical protein